MTIRDLITANIHAVVDTIDLHEATVEDDGTHVCYCRQWRGTEDAYYDHLADVLSEKLAPQPQLAAVAGR